MIETAAPPPNFDAFPCMGDADTFDLLQGALPCRCGSRNIIPGSDLDYPPTLAIICRDCERMAGFASTLAVSVKIWNAWSMTAPGRHIWCGTEGDAEEVCCQCGAYPHTLEAAARCPDDLDPWLSAEERE